MKNLLKSNSVLEEKLYIFLRNCEKCGKGPLNWEIQRLVTKDEKPVDVIDTKCSQCGHEKTFYFDITNFYKDYNISKKIKINKTDKPSNIIDIVEYTNLALFNFNILKQIITKNDKDIDYYVALSESCIKEALKFYKNSITLNKKKALFSKKTENVFNKNPNAFSKKILKLHQYKINSFCNNLDDMKKIYSGLTGDKEKDKNYLKQITPGYRKNKEVLKEIGRLMYEILPTEEKEKLMKSIPEDVKDYLINNK